MILVVRNDLPEWQILNTVAHMGAFLGNKIGSYFDTGEYFMAKDGSKYPRNSQYPIIVLSILSEELPALLDDVRNTNLVWISFTKDMIETTDDFELEDIFGSKDSRELDILGIGLFGDKEKVSVLTKKFKLWK